jgi:hypothetical protein
LITTSEGHYFPDRDADCVPVRIWAEASDAEYIAVRMTGSDDELHADSFVLLRPEDALHLAEELQTAVKRQERWAKPRAVATRAVST